MSHKIIETNFEIKDWFSYLHSENILVDMWITDPPYPFDNKNGTGRFLYEDGVDGLYDRMTWDDLSVSFCRMFDASNEGSRAYVFSNKDGLFETKSRMEQAGWTFRNILIWNKKRMGMGYHWRHSVEYILYFSKGKPLSYVKGKSNILSYKKPRGGSQSVKPFELWVDILEWSAVSGDICADPFSGSNPMKKAILGYSNLESKINMAYTNVFIT
jgi:site-specific DNA-methyltransferase (adenine-specific)